MPLYELICKQPAHPCVEKPLIRCCFPPCLSLANSGGELSESPTEAVRATRTSTYFNLSDSYARVDMQFTGGISGSGCRRVHAGCGEHNAASKAPGRGQV
jgi:hypothetical protein